MSILDSDLELSDTFKKNKQKKGKSLHRRFNLKHVFRGGAVVWLKSGQKDYYAVFKSLSRPNRGVQLPGGRIERYENPGQAIIREVKEETGIETKIICPLGYVFFENPEDAYSNLQIYYIVRPVFPLNVNQKWRYTDKDKTRQELECWFTSSDESSDFLAAGQDKVIDMFKDWLNEHKPENKEQIIAKKFSSKNKNLVTSSFTNMRNPQPFNFQAKEQKPSFNDEDIQNKIDQKSLGLDLIDLN
jgi:8-oxo-dGTP pyrophosphatase MutT (NUDIX family)